jgi:2-keto-4-pentenoate hydratase
MSFRTSELAADARVRRGLEAQFAERERLLAAGAEPLGWKLGFGTAAAMQKLGTAAPLIGFLTSRSMAQPGSSSVAGWAKPLIESEIAVRVDTAGGPVASTLAPAFELADLDPPPDDVETILAGNLFHRRVILGPETSAGGVDLGSAGAAITVNDELTEVPDPLAATGEIGELLEHVGALLASFGADLRTGEVVICGSIVPPIEVRAGDEVSYAVEGLGSLAVEIDGGSRGP